MAMRGPRNPIGSAPWVVDERRTALQIAQEETDEFSFSAKNEMDWLNEHMAEIFSENDINVAEIFKTPGKLRGKTPRTARKNNRGDMRAPLTDVFSSTPKGSNPFAIPKLALLQSQQQRNSPSFKVAEDHPIRRKSPSPRVSIGKGKAKAKTTKPVITRKAVPKRSPKAAVAAAPEQPPAPPSSQLSQQPSQPSQPSLVDSGYHGSQDMDVDVLVEDEVDVIDEYALDPTQTETVVVEPTQPKSPEDTGDAAQNDENEPPANLHLSTSSEERVNRRSLTQATTENSFHSAQEEQDQLEQQQQLQVLQNEDEQDQDEQTVLVARHQEESKSSSPVRSPSPAPKAAPEPSSPLQSTTPACPPPPELLATLGVGAAPVSPVPVSIESVEIYEDLEDQENEQNEQTQKDELSEQSPERPLVRKSSINFASLPAREPFTSNKSLGGAARKSHIDQSRPSYYSRVTGGKSLGNAKPTVDDDEDDERDELDEDEGNAFSHNKTYTQRLQDRISMLGKSQVNAPRPSKSLANHLPALAQKSHVQPQSQAQQSPKRTEKPENMAKPPPTPGAFPEDDDDDWILPVSTMSPRLNLAKSTAPAPVESSAEMAETEHHDLHHLETSPLLSPKRAQPPVIPERTTSAFSHKKSASVPTLLHAQAADPEAEAAKKPISVSNPTNASTTTLAMVTETDHELAHVPTTPSKSPSSRRYHDSPLKQVKNKLSSIIKSSKGLLASSAAISAEGKSSLLSPSTMRLGMMMAPSTDSLVSKPLHGNGSTATLAYPDLTRQMTASTMLERPISPTRSVRKTRASVERERRELKLREKELKEVQIMTEQIGKLEKMREKEREKARIFNEEHNRERAAALERERKAEREAREAERERERLEQIERERVERERVEQMERERAEAERERLEQMERERAEAERERERAEAERERERAERERVEQERAEAERERIEKEKAERDRQQWLDELATPHKTASPSRVPTKATRSSPRRHKAQQAEADVDMAETAPSRLPPPSTTSSHSTVSSTTSSVPRSTNTRNLRRPLRPTKETASKTKQAPTVIRVNTSSSQSQFHPSNSILAASLHETLAGPGPRPSSQQQQSHIKNKASTTSLHGKPSLQSLKSSVSSTGRPKALELAAKRKEQEEREAQRKRDAKAELERKRAAQQAAQQEQEEQRRQDMQRQREEAAKKAAAQQRRAAIEKAKQTRAPPPAPRTQLPNGPTDQLAQSQPPRPQSRIGTMDRPVNAVLGKSLSKRALPGGDSHEVKRMRMSEEFDEDELDMGGNVPRVSSIKGPPVRPSNAYKKELPNKSIFGNGYATAPASSNITRDLFKATVTAQHNHQVRAANPMDMAQVSKAAIPFAPAGTTATTGPTAAAVAGPSSATMPPPHKTPVRPVGAALTAKSTAKSMAKSGKSATKSAAKSSPRVPNGDGIELPEIQTDDEDSDEEGQMNVASWADSPDLRRALMRQETIDPMAVFGPPAPLNMEEVFNKNKERWNKFRARSSSANWSGVDRLTEDDIRKDLAARDKIRREGGWSYDLSGI